MAGPSYKRRCDGGRNLFGNPPARRAGLGDWVFIPPPNLALRPPDHGMAPHHSVPETFGGDPAKVHFGVLLYEWKGAESSVLPVRGLASTLQGPSP